MHYRSPRRRDRERAESLFKEIVEENCPKWGEIWTSKLLKLSIEFFSSVIVFFSSTTCLVLSYIFCLFVILLILFLYFPDFIKLFICVLL